MHLLSYTSFRMQFKNTNHSILKLCIKQLCIYCPTPVSECSVGVPDRVCTDKGGENVHVWQLVIHIHVSPSAVLAGSSTHNVRIERLWRDMYCCVSGHYYELFYTLEKQQLLNPLNDTDLYCLHYMFLPRISKHFLDFWNHHSLSSEHNHTPYQLMLLGLRDRPSQAQLVFTAVLLHHSVQCGLATVQYSVT